MALLGLLCSGPTWSDPWALAFLGLPGGVAVLGGAAVSPGKQDEEEIMNQFLTLYSRWAFLWHRIGNSVATLEDKHLFSRD